MIPVKTKRTAYHLIGPGTALLLAWVVMGRSLFGVGGWLIVIMWGVAPLMAIGVLATTYLAIRQRRDDEGFLTDRQFRRLVAMWALLFATGLFLVEVGDTEFSRASAFTRIVGWDAGGGSVALGWLCATGALGAWVMLLDELIKGQHGAVRRTLDTVQRRQH